MILILPITVQGQLLNVEGRIDSLVQTFNQERRVGFNGNILVSKDGEIVYNKCFGCSNCPDFALNTVNTSFYIASVSKSFTSIAILKLVETGKIGLDQTIDSILPDLPRWSSTVSIRNLLNHTAGIPDYMRNGWVVEGITNSQVLSKLKTITHLDFRPGTKFKYSNSGYILLAYIIEIVTRKTYEDYLKESIFSPSNMTNTWVYTMNSTNKGMADRAFGFKTNQRKTDDYKLLTYGDGGIYSTSSDLYKLSNSLTNHKILSKSSLDEMSSPTVLENGTVKPYGFGWFLGENTNGNYIYHTGQLAGFRTYYEIQLDTDNTVVILNNTSINNIEVLRNGIMKVL